MKKIPYFMGQEKLVAFKDMMINKEDYGDGFILHGVYSVESNSRIALQTIKSPNSDASYTEATYRADHSELESDEEWLLFCRGMGM